MAARAPGRRAARCGRGCIRPRADFPHCSADAREVSPRCIAAIWRPARCGSRSSAVRPAQVRLFAVARRAGAVSRATTRGLPAPSTTRISPPWRRTTIAYPGSSGSSQPRARSRHSRAARASSAACRWTSAGPRSASRADAQRRVNLRCVTCGVATVRTSSRPCRSSTAVEQPLAAPEQRRHQIDLHLVDETRREVLLRGVRAAGERDVLSLAAATRALRSAAFDAVGHERERGAAIERERCARVMRQHEDGVMKRGVVAPPAVPRRFLAPRARVAAEHVATHDRSRRCSRAIPRRPRCSRSPRRRACRASRARPASGNTHSCSRMPPMPSGFSTLCCGPATKPSSDIEILKRSFVMLAPSGVASVSSAAADSTARSLASTRARCRARRGRSCRRRSRRSPSGGYRARTACRAGAQARALQPGERPWQRQHPDPQAERTCRHAHDVAQRDHLRSAQLEGTTAASGALERRDDGGDDVADINRGKLRVRARERKDTGRHAQQPAKRWNRPSPGPNTTEGRKITTAGGSPPLRRAGVRRRPCCAGNDSAPRSASA